MIEKRTPFWVEGMDAARRAQCITTLLAVLDGKLAARVQAGVLGQTTTFVFAPDPPPRGFGALAKAPELQLSSWGGAGQAISTTSRDVATELAPRVFDLWPDALYVLAFLGRAKDEATLAEWISEVVEKEKNSGSVGPILGEKLPPHGLVWFDWGDWVGDAIE